MSGPINTELLVLSIGAYHRLPTRTAVADKIELGYPLAIKPPARRRERLIETGLDPA